MRPGVHRVGKLIPAAACDRRCCGKQVTYRSRRTYFYLADADAVLPKSQCCRRVAVHSCQGLRKPLYYRALAKAEVLLARSPDVARTRKIRQAVDSMSRLYLQGKFDQEMPSIEAPGNTP
jgi:hypothetical protein